MDKYQRITDDEIFKTIKAVDDNEENSLADALKTLLLVTLDIRQFIRKMYKNNTNSIYGKNGSNVYKQPTNNSKDIIVGEE